MRRLRIIHFDVSQGESTLVSLLGPLEDFHVLIDGGRRCRGQYVLRCLKQLDIQTLDFVICTHLDNDHHEGLVPVIESDIEVGFLLVPEFGHNVDKFNGLKMACEDKDVDWKVAKVGSLIDDGDFAMEIIHVGIPTLKDDNVASIACLVQLNSFVYYTAGDLPFEIEEKLKLPDHVCAFKCGHHGAETSTSKEFVEQIAPTAAFISAGRHAHGHPRQEVINSLRGAESLQRFYSTNCVYGRQGFINGPQGGSEPKGLVCSSRKDGILGHTILYTDEKLSDHHDGAKVNFFVLRPPANERSTTWRAYKHVCGNKKHRPREVLPGGIVHLRAAEFPEFRLSALSRSLTRKKRKMTTLFDFPKFYDDLREKNEGGEDLIPSSPIHKFTEDPPNFTMKKEGEDDSNSNKAPNKLKRKWTEMQHASKWKRTSECIGCLQSPKEVEGELVSCNHKEEWFVCEDCESEFPDGFDCTRL